MIEPLFVPIAAVVAGRGILALYHLVKDQFADDPTATAILKAAAAADPDSPEVEALGVQLEQASENDPEFAARLRRTWESINTHQHADSSDANNHTAGYISGNVVQARDIHGGLHL